MEIFDFSCLAVISKGTLEALYLRLETCDLYVFLVQ